MATKNCNTKPKQKKRIPAVAYCRKSTNEEGAAKSIADQKARIRELKPADPEAEYEVVRWYTADLGVPGWRRGAARPDYHKLVGDLKEIKVKAVLVDDFDRFSRSDPMETVSDVQALRELGVRFVHAVNQGSRDLVEGGAMVAMQIAMDANASHEFSTRLSRRISEARKGRAEQGKRSGGAAPYGMADDGDGGLVEGDPAEAETARWIFDAFTNKRQSLSRIAGDLNRREIKPPRGKHWYAASVKSLLQRRAYRGTFSYGENPAGQFHRLEGNKVVKVSRYDEPNPADGNGVAPFVLEGAWEPLVDPALWDRAQKRIASFGGGERKPRGTYPLSGLIVCDHCGSRMYPTTRSSGKVFYQCRTAAQVGVGCNNYSIAQDDILPFVLQLLGEEIDRVLTLPEPALPDVLRPKAGRDKAGVEKRMASLRAKIDRAEDNLLEATDARSRQSMDAKIKAMWAEMDVLEADLQVDESEQAEQADQLKQLAEWWAEARGKLYAVPYAVESLPDELADTKAFIGAFDGPTGYKHVDAGALQEVLTALGAEIRLRWKTSQVTLSNGQVQNRYSLTRGRFRLGQESGLIRSLSYTSEG